jgi:hypothetical protein
MINFHYICREDSYSHVVWESMSLITRLETGIKIKGSLGTPWFGVYYDIPVVYTPVRNRPVRVFLNDIF